MEGGRVSTGVTSRDRAGTALRASHGVRRALAVLAGIALFASCAARDPEASLDTRMWTDDLAFRIRLTPRPPYAREDVIVKVVIADKESGAPVENGEGRIYAMSRDSVKVYDGLERGPEPGTYYAKLNFLTAGEWAIGLQFRRDSTKKLETMDWLQSVQNAR
jgi:hypothetical protein